MRQHPERDRYSNDERLILGVSRGARFHTIIFQAVNIKGSIHTVAVDIHPEQTPVDSLGAHEAAIIRKNGLPVHTVQVNIGRNYKILVNGEVRIVRHGVNDGQHQINLSAVNRLALMEPKEPAA